MLVNNDLDDDKLASSSKKNCDVLKSSPYLVFNLIIFLSLFNTVLAHTQVPPDSTSFIPPITYEMKLAGSFAELRSNHFHAGIDIKSKDGRGGDAIIASEKGHISRIKVQSGSYGKAIYMDHPNGYTTVYAHLEKFHPSLEKFIEKIQKKIQQFEVDIYLPQLDCKIISEQSTNNISC